MEQKNLYYRKEKQHSPVTQYFLKALHRRGNLNRAKKIWKLVIKNILSKRKENPWNLIFMSLYYLIPLVDMRTIRIARHHYQVPAPIRSKRALSLAISWMMETSGGKNRSESLASEIIAVTEGKSKILQRRKDWEDLARKKMRYARYRWH